MFQRNLISFNILKSFFFLCSILLVASCTVTSDDDEVTPQDEDVTFRVDLLKMAALEIKDGEGEYLEIYGLVNSKVVRGNITEENALWSVVKENALNVGTSDTPLTESVTYTIAKSDIANSTLQVAADLWDYDGSAGNNPEDLGEGMISTPLSSVTTSVTYDIVLDDSSGQVIKVTYSITRE